MLTKLPEYTSYPGVAGRSGREEFTHCVETPPSTPPGSWKQVCSEVLAEFKQNTGVAAPPGGTIRTDATGAPIIYQQGDRLFFAFWVCRSEWVSD